MSPLDAVKAPIIVVLRRVRSPLKADCPLTSTPLEAVSCPDTVTTPLSAVIWFVTSIPLEAVSRPCAVVISLKVALSLKVATSSKVTVSSKVATSATFNAPDIAVAPLIVALDAVKCVVLIPLEAVNSPDTVTTPLSASRWFAIDNPLEAVSWPDIVTTPLSANRWFVMDKPLEPVSCPETVTIPLSANKWLVIERP